MARIARKYSETNFFHVIVQGLNKEEIFKEKRYIYSYLKMLYKYREDTKIIILAYCIMNNHAHIVLYTESIEEMSKYMQKVNTNYAKYYNYINNGRVGYVFRDRYVSEDITDVKYLINCINYVHLNPVKAKIVKKCEDYKFSTYNQYIEGNRIKLLNELTNMKFDIELFKNIKDSEYTIEEDTNIEEFIDKKIKRHIITSNMNKDEILQDRVILKKIITILKEIYRIKYVDMMKYFNMTRGKMQRLME